MVCERLICASQTDIRFAKPEASGLLEELLVWIWIEPLWCKVFLEFSPNPPPPPAPLLFPPLSISIVAPFAAQAATVDEGTVIGYGAGLVACVVSLAVGFSIGYGTLVKP